MNWVPTTAGAAAAGAAAAAPLLTGTCEMLVVRFVRAYVRTYGNRGTPQSGGSISVGLRISEPTASVALERNDGTGTLAGVETATAEGTVGIRLAGTGNELSACSLSRDVGTGDDGH